MKSSSVHEDFFSWQTRGGMYLAPFSPDRSSRNLLPLLYYNMGNFCNLTGFEQWYFSFIRNNFIWNMTLTWLWRVVVETNIHRLRKGLLRTLVQGFRGSTPLSRHAHNCWAFRSAIAPRQTLSKFVNQGYLVYSTLPLGWEAGAYAYHTTGLVHLIPSTSLIVVQARLWCTRRWTF